MAKAITKGERLSHALSQKSSGFKLAEYVGDNSYVVKKNNGVFVWDNGHLLKYEINNDELTVEEYMYIHLQKRPMELCVNNDCMIFKIIPNKIEVLECYPLTVGNFKRIKRKHYNLHGLKIRYRFMKEKLKNIKEFLRWT